MPIMDGRKFGSGLSIDFGDIESIRYCEDGRAEEAHIIQAKHGAMDIED